MPVRKVTNTEDEDEAKQGQEAHSPLVHQVRPQSSRILEPTHWQTVWGRRVFMEERWRMHGTGAGRNGRTRGSLRQATVCGLETSLHRSRSPIHQSMLIVNAEQPYLDHQSLPLPQRKRQSRWPQHKALGPSSRFVQETKHIPGRSLAPALPQVFHFG